MRVPDGVNDLAHYVAKALVEIAGGTPGISAATLVEMAHAKVQATKNKPWDMEVRVAPAVFNRFKNADNGTLVLVSTFDLQRIFVTPRDLALLLWHRVEEEGRVCMYYIQCDQSGFLCVTTAARAEALRLQSTFPCPHCVQWCKGEKGLWWHRQKQHGIHHGEAMEAVMAERNESAIVIYDPDQMRYPSDRAKPDDDEKIKIVLPVDDDPWEQVKRGDLTAIRHSIRFNAFQPSTALDQRGASPLLWAAGGGHLEVVRFLVEEARCDPHFRQKGKRSFHGRTALHWAARNGHLNVVRYLVQECYVDLEAVTLDGTTSFCWAAWQAQRDVLVFLYESGCNTRNVNSFGCNAALWAAQGHGDASLLEWLKSVGCPCDRINENGHSVLHKAAQRGRRDICEWFIKSFLARELSNINLDLVGPNSEQCTPSDLAGMEHHYDLAAFLSAEEERLVVQSSSSPESWHCPSWLVLPRIRDAKFIDSKPLWEPGGGVERMGRVLLKLTTKESQLFLESSAHP